MNAARNLIVGDDVEQKSTWPVVAFVFYLTTLVFEAPLRYGLSLGGAQSLLYIRDIIAIVVVVASMVGSQGLADSASLIRRVVAILFFHALIGILFIQNPIQVIFAIKICLPFLFGIVASHAVLSQGKQIAWRIGLLLTFLAVGVVADKFVVFPWRGLSYELAGVTVEGVREWTAMGSRRLAGFSRSSIDAGILALTLACLLMPFVARKYVVLTMLSVGWIIVLTTSKGILLAYGLVGFVLMISLLPIDVRVIPILISLLALAGILLPLFSQLFGFHVDRHSGIQMMLFSSFMERIDYMWPGAFELLNLHGHALLGRGLGGIGVAQVFFEPVLFNSADNISVHGYVTFGVFWLFYLFYSVKRFVALRPYDDNADLCACLLVLSALAYGLTTNIIESGSFGLMLGLAMGRAFTSVREGKASAQIAS